MSHPIIEKIEKEQRVIELISVASFLTTVGIAKQKIESLLKEYTQYQMINGLQLKLREAGEDKEKCAQMKQMAQTLYRQYQKELNVELTALNPPGWKMKDADAAAKRAFRIGTSPFMKRIFKTLHRVYGTETKVRN